MATKIIGVDPGSLKSGLLSLTGTSINWAAILPNEQVAARIGTEVLTPSTIVFIEDIAAYDTRIMPPVIDTCKFIGELKYRLEIECGASVQMVSRSALKRHVFTHYRDISEPLIREKMKKRGVDREPTLMWVDDKIVSAAMKWKYGIETPKPGKGYQFGLKSHSFQALCVADFAFSIVGK